MVNRSQLSATIHVGDDTLIYGRLLGSTGIVRIDNLRICTDGPATLEAIADTVAKLAVELRRAQQRQQMAVA